MKHGRLLWRIYIYFLIAALAALAIATGHAVHTLRRFHESHVADNLETHARLASRDILRLDLAADPSRADVICKQVGELTGSRMTVILPGGLVIGDSDKDPSGMDNHAGRPEIARALQGTVGTSIRHSDTLKQRLKYTAIPVERDGDIIAVVRMSQPLAEIRWSQQTVSRQLLIGAFLAALLFALVALTFSRRITRPLENMRHVARQLAKGNLDARADVTTDDEVGSLARTLNEMAEQLGQRMETIVRQHVEQDAVLACMVEGVLAVDTQGRILYLNDSLAHLLDVDARQARGKTVQEAIRHHEVQEFVVATPGNTEPSEAEVLLRGVPERHVQLQGTPLVEPGGRRIGGLVVVNDVTRLKRLERVRSDFVANVSHELKTPITALKGCVETLDGGTPLEPDDAAHFTAMISRHVARLEAIVEDLLSLSRIEFESSSKRVECDTASISALLERVDRRSTSRASAKSISLNISCPEDLSAPINTSLVEQAVMNLVDNAIKYSGEDTTVDVSAREEAGQVVISVADQGPGIEARHLSRLFERFYRVDTARSRALGGTGLGLSIVKHIALAHKGNVTVDSSVGRGTTFTLRLPKP